MQNYRRKDVQIREIIVEDRQKGLNYRELSEKYEISKPDVKN